MAQISFDKMSEESSRRIEAADVFVSHELQTASCAISEENAKETEARKTSFVHSRFSTVRSLMWDVMGMLATIFITVFFVYYILMSFVSVAISLTNALNPTQMVAAGLCIFVLVWYYAKSMQKYSYGAQEYARQLQRQQWVHQMD